MSGHRITTSLEAEQILLQEAATRKANKRFPEETLLAEVLTGMLRRKGLTKDAPLIVSRDRTGRSRSSCTGRSPPDTSRSRPTRTGSGVASCPSP